MGASASAIGPQELEEYCDLLYLTKSEILDLYERCLELGPEIARARNTRFDKVRIGLVFPELRWNPFLDRILDVFSSEGDEKLSFEDLLDIFSATNQKCPPDVMAAWAFKIYDFDGDGHLNREDVAGIIDRLLPGQDNRFITSELVHDDKLAIADKILQDLDLDKTGGITSTEFIHAVTKMPDFFNSYRLKV